MDLDFSRLETENEVHLLLVNLGFAHAYRLLAAAAARAGVVPTEIDRAEREALRYVDHARRQFGEAPAQDADRLTDEALEALRAAFSEAKTERTKH